MESMTIGRVAKQSGVGVDAVRFYERQGLIPKPPRTPSGYRQYSTDTVARLGFIQRAKELGFSLVEIRELISLRIEADTDCGAVKQKAEAKIADIDEKIRDLGAMRRGLERLTAACAGEGPASECPILASLDPAMHTGDLPFT